jgi:hypothetical protein
MWASVVMERSPQLVSSQSDYLDAARTLLDKGRCECARPLRTHAVDGDARGVNTQDGEGRSALLEAANLWVERPKPIALLISRGRT